jgi:hypothetical protein
MVPHVKYAADVRMGDLAGQLHLAPEAFQERRIPQQIGAQDLQRDSAAEFEVLRLVNFAHSAPAQESYDPKPASQYLVWVQYVDWFRTGDVPKYSRGRRLLVLTEQPPQFFS